MQISELRFILKNCFDPASLQALVGTNVNVNEVYDEAIEAVLNDEPHGQSVVAALDKGSIAQQQKIRAMNVRELRNSFQVDFLEPGRKLGMIGWALLRDDRLPVQTIASDLINHFLNQEEDTSYEAWFEESDEAETESSGPAPDISFDESDDPASDIEVDDLLSDLNEPDHDVDDDEQDLLGAWEEDDVPDTDVTHTLSEDEINREVDEILDTLESNIKDESLSMDESLLHEPDPIIDESESMLESAPDSSDSGEDVPSLEDVDSLLASVTSDEDDEDDIEDEEDVITRSVSDFNASPSGDDGDEDSLLDIQLPDVQVDEPIDGDSIEVGGVLVRLESLKSAYDSIFDESVELVTDEAITRENKIVVVGKQCGFHVVYATHETIPQPSPDELSIDATVHVHPDSIRKALSVLYGEAIEIIPDSTLLEQGIVCFTGKKTGLKVIRHPRVMIPVDMWHNESEIPHLQPATNPVAEKLALVDALEERVADLESRLHELSTSSAALPPAVTAPEPEEEAIEELPGVVGEIAGPEPEEDDAIAEAPISMDDLETDELEPEPEPSSESDEDDIMAALAEVDEATEEESQEDADTGDESEDAADDSGDEFDLEALGDLSDFGESDDETSEDELSLEGLGLEDLGDDDSGEEEETPDEGDEMDLGALDDLVGGLGDEDDGAEESDSSGDDDELSLEGLGLDDLDSDSESEDSGDSLDLDVLSELDGDDEDEAPPKLLNGEKILLLGGEDEHIEDYERIVREIGGEGEWYGSLAHMPEEEIVELVNGSDLILTVTDEALSDPGILSASNAAQENNKRLFDHHSANPTSIQKKLVSLIQDGNM